jgi:hypothetical protein
MAFDANAANVTVGVVGTGSMGRGIMQGGAGRFARDCLR